MAAADEMRQTGADSSDYQPSDDGINLTDAEATALAFRVVEDWCHHGDHPEWEDVPMLGEHAFERLCKAIVKVGEMCHIWADVADALLTVDSASLLLRARDDSVYSGSNQQVPR